MAGLYVYALLEPTRRPQALRGLGRRAVRVVVAAGLRAAVGEAPSGLSPTLANLRAHEGVVRRLCEASPAVLPLRFGTCVEDEAALAALVRPRRQVLGRALRKVRGRTQFSLRLTGERPRREEGGPPASGAQWLRARAAQSQVPELAQAVRAVKAHVVEERAQRYAKGPFVATVFHLVDRRDARAYVRAVRKAPGPGKGLRLLVLGPQPPWAFAPEVGE